METETGPPRTDGFAVAALVLGILGVSLLAIVFGVIGRGRTNEDPSLQGRGMATAGIVLGIAWACVSVAVLAAMIGLAPFLGGM